jgi:dienelactone hydrolase
MPKAPSVGEVVTFNGVPCYLKGAGANCIVVGHDIMGIDSGLTQAICDELARDLECMVVIPTFWPSGAPGGPEAARPVERLFDPVGESVWTFPWCVLLLLYNLPAFLRDMRGTGWAVVRPKLMDSVLPALRERGAARFGLLGFCWGGWAVMHASAEPDFRCAVSCHPAIQQAAMVDEKEQDIFAAIVCPQLLLVSHKDAPSVQPGGAAVQTLSAKPFGADCDVCVFTQPHGWMNRGDPADPAVKRDQDECYARMLAFFTKHLTAATPAPEA